MKIFKGVFGSKESAEPLIINVDTVYINSNIKKVENEDADLYKYDQMQLSKNEYIEMISKENRKLKSCVNDLNEINLEKDGIIEKLSEQMNNVIEMLLEEGEVENE